MKATARLSTLACLGVMTALTKSQPLDAQAMIVNIATDATDPNNSGDQEPSIAVNPTNPLDIVVVAFSGNWAGANGAAVWRSINGGRTWRRDSVPNAPPPPAAGQAMVGPGDRKVAFDSLGNLYIAELADVRDALFQRVTLLDFVYRQTSAPGAALALAPGAGYGYDQPHLELDRRGASPCAGTIYSPWLDFAQAHQRSTVSRSTNAGVNMADVAAGDNSSFSNRTTRIALARNGRAYVVYKTREGQVGTTPFERAHFRVQRSDNCGQSWNALGVGGVSVHGSSAVQTYFTADGFGNKAKGLTQKAKSSDAWIAADPSDGDVYVAYVARDSSGVARVNVARSVDSGVTWRSSPATSALHNAAYPEIAVADNGTVGLLYIDYDDSGTHNIYRHRFTRSFDNGATWHDQVLQSMDADNLVNAAAGWIWGDYEGLTALGDRFYGAFTGHSTGRTTLQLDPVFFTESALEPAFAYAAKAICGVQSDPAGGRLAAGAYSTVINVYNPNDTQVTLASKLAVTFPPPGRQPGEIAYVGDITLAAGQAIKVDCPDLAASIYPDGLPQPYVEGVLSLASTDRLDVSAVYSANDTAGRSISVDVEPILGHRVTRVPPVVHAAGTVTLRTGTGFGLSSGYDLDGTGSENDIQLEPVTVGSPYWKLTPANGATVHAVGMTSIGKDGCERAPLAGSAIHEDNLPVGTFVCVRTNLGRLAELRIESKLSGMSRGIVFTYTTWQAIP